MNRGQSEYIGITILVILIVAIAYVSSEWLSSIVSVANNVINAIEHAKEFLDIGLEKGNISITNKGVGRSKANFMYLELKNRSIYVEKIGLEIASGQTIHLAIDYDNVKKVCIETENGNIFCSYSYIDNSNSYSYGCSLGYERIPPIYLGYSDTNHVPYRVKRIITPDTYLYVYSSPIEHTTIVSNYDDILHMFPMYIGKPAIDNRYISIISHSYTEFDLPKLVDHDDSTAGILMQSTIAYLDLCIDLGKIEKGWLYIHMTNIGSSIGAQTYIAISNNTCLNPVNETIIYRNIIGRDVKGVWLVNTRSIRLYINRFIYYINTIEFYPYNTTKTMLGFPSTLYNKPIGATISIFTLSNTYIQTLELIPQPQQKQELEIR